MCLREEICNSVYCLYSNQVSLLLIGYTTCTYHVLLITKYLSLLYSPFPLSVSSLLSSLFLYFRQMHKLPKNRMTDDVRKKCKKEDEKERHVIKKENQNETRYVLNINYHPKMHQLAPPPLLRRHLLQLLLEVQMIKTKNALFHRCVFNNSLYALLDYITPCLKSNQ